MDETKKAIAKKMKCMDLAGELGKVLRVNPVWKDNYVIYGSGLDDEDELDNNCVGLWLDLEDVRWGFTTGNHGFIYLPKEAPDLMARMSETIEGE